MGLPDTEMEALIRSDYAQGFVTEIESDTLPPGLDEDVIRTISERKGEPDWMLEKRLTAYRHWLTLQEPNWAAVRHPPIDFQAISYYSSPKKKPTLESLDQVDPELLATYEKLGIPIDDMTERLSDVMVTAITSLGVQKLAYAIGVAFVPPILAACLFLLSLLVWYEPLGHVVDGIQHLPHRQRQTDARRFQLQGGVFDDGDRGVDGAAGGIGQAGGGDGAPEIVVRGAVHQRQGCALEENHHDGEHDARHRPQGLFSGRCFHVVPFIRRQVCRPPRIARGT